MKNFKKTNKCVLITLERTATREEVRQPSFARQGPKASRLWYAESLNNFKKIFNQDKESEVSPYSSSKILSFPCDSLPNSDLKDFITKSSNPV